MTARNKMRHAGDDIVRKSLDGTPVWTSSVSVGKRKIEHNEKLMFQMFDDLMREKKPIFNKTTGNYVFPNVSYIHVRSFLKEYAYPEMENILFDRDAILDMIDSGLLTMNWDIAIQHGGGDKYPEATKRGFSIQKTKRSSYSVRGQSDDDLNVRFTSASIMSPSNMSEGIFNDYTIDGKKLSIPDDEINGSPERIKLLGETYLQRQLEVGNTDIKDPPAKAYLRTSNRRPLMLLFPLQLSLKTGDPNTDKKELVTSLGSSTPIGVALGFPLFGEDSDERLIIKYKTSVVYSKMGGNDDLDDEDL